MDAEENGRDTAARVAATRRSGLRRGRRYRMGRARKPAPPGASAPLRV